VNAHVRRARIHVGAPAQRIAEAVAYRVFNAQCDEVEALQRAALRRHVDADAARDRERLWPVEFPRSAIDVVFAAIRHGEQARQDACRDAAFQVGAVGDRVVTRERDTSGDVPHFTRAEVGQLGGKQVFQAARAGGKQAGVGLRGHRNSRIMD